MKQLFQDNPRRFDDFSLRWQDIFVDYSKNRIDDRTLSLLYNLAKDVQLADAIEKMFRGDTINETENRAVLHVALRNRSNNPVRFDGSDVMPGVIGVLEQIKTFVKQLHDGTWKGYSGKKVQQIVNIGIGGSDLGPKMVCTALKPYAKKGVSVHFVSNVDGTHLTETLRNLNPETTLFVIASKTFTTQETMSNAYSARKWFLSHASDNRLITKHFIAISTNTKAVESFGIDQKNMFRFWDWVGGRFSLWSAIGLPIACYVGYENFEALLEGAYEMDNHFRSTSFEHNLPVILALISIWNVNFLGADTEAILPYDQYLQYLPAYLQQGCMESNGKSIDRNHQPVTYKTGSIVWGEPGTSGQHAFYQLIHQGTHLVPSDFIAPVLSHNPLGSHHEILLSNLFGQAEALMKGKSAASVLTELQNKGLSEEQIQHLIPHRVFEGNRPSNTILIKQLTPRVLGSLIAMYEHKIFVQGIIWNIFSFDQWGVELGKELAGEILPELQNDHHVDTHDPSTNGLINTYKSMR